MKKNLFTMIILSCILIGCGTTQENEKIELGKSWSDIQQEASEESEEEAGLDEFNAQDILKKEYDGFVIAEYTPAKYESTKDGKPDYSGIYVDEGGPGSCDLIKQPDGTYSFYIGMHRAFAFSGTAKYVSEDILSFTDEYNHWNGTIEVKPHSATVTAKNSETEEYIDRQVYDSYMWDYPDLSNYVGEYKYTDEEGKETIITVGYEENREPIITVNQDNDTFEFHHYDENSLILVGEFSYDENTYDNHETLVALFEPQDDGPSDDYAQFVKYTSGPKYLMIDNSGKQSKLYYKTMVPNVLH